jgi:DNA mismatch endonuclease, patch repair protein
LTDKLTKDRRSANMAAIRSKDMKPEMIVRRLVHGMGYRYRLHRKGLPGKPDLVFGPKRKVIFVHGCFWHQHDKAECLDGRLPKSNTGYWGPKLQRNVERDQSNVVELSKQGWDVLVVWECETGDEGSLRQRLQKFLN